MRYLFIVALLLFPFTSIQGKDSLDDQAKIYRDKGYQLQTTGDLAAALVYYRKALELRPYDAQVYNDLGVVYEAMGNEDQALSMYERAVELDSTFLPVYANIYRSKFLGYDLHIYKAVCESF